MFDLPQITANAAPAFDAIPTLGATGPALVALAAIAGAIVAASVFSRF